MCSFKLSKCKPDSHEAQDHDKDFVCETLYVGATIPTQFLRSMILDSLTFTVLPKFSAYACPLFRVLSVKSIPLFRELHSAFYSSYSLDLFPQTHSTWLIQSPYKLKYILCFHYSRLLHSRKYI